MQRLKTAVIVAAGIVVVILGSSWLLPSHWQVRRSIVVAAPPGALLPLVANLRTGWPQWSAFDAEDPEIQYSYSGPEEGPGAERSWTSGTLGNGSQKIVRADARGVEFELRMANGFAIAGIVSFDPAPGGTRVTWTDSGEVGNNPAHRFLAAFMDRMMGATFEKSLGALKQKAEAAARR